MFDKSRIPFKAIATEGILPSRLQRALYRRRGYSIAPDVELAPGVVIDAEEVSIGPGCSIGFGTVIRGRRVVLGRRVSIGSACFFEGRDIEIGDDTVFREQVLVGGPLFPDSLLKLGKRVRVFQTCVFNPSRPIVIGDDTGVGGRSSLFTHGSWQPMLEGYPVTFEPITIGRNVWLPWHVFILPGVEIGDNAAISAGSVVMRSVPAGALAAGVPARVMQKEENWPPRPEPEEQWERACDIVREFAAHLRANGVATEERSDGDEFLVSLRWNGHDRRVRLLRGDTAPASQRPSDIMLFLDGANADGNGGTWFDLLGHRKQAPNDDVVKELESFISRYGTRFVPVDEI